MKAIIDADLCTACGACVDICPGVFEMGEMVAQVKQDPVLPGDEQSCREACDACPVDAIMIED